MKNNRRLSARPARRTPSVLERIQIDVAGIDCGASEHFVSVPPDRDPTPIQSFRTFTADLERLADWLVACRVTSVAMEATGVYWIPLFDILEARGLEVLVATRSVWRQRRAAEADARRHLLGGPTRGAI